MAPGPCISPKMRYWFGIKRFFPWSQFLFELLTKIFLPQTHRLDMASSFALKASASTVGNGFTQPWLLAQLLSIWKSLRRKRSSMERSTTDFTGLCRIPPALSVKRPVSSRNGLAISRYRKIRILDILIAHSAPIFFWSKAAGDLLRRFSLKSWMSSSREKILPSHQGSKSSKG